MKSFLGNFYRILPIFFWSHCLGLNIFLSFDIFKNLFDNWISFFFSSVISFFRSISATAATVFQIFHQFPSGEMESLKSLQRSQNQARSLVGSLTRSQWKIFINFLKIGGNKEVERKEWLCQIALFTFSFTGHNLGTGRRCLLCCG